MTSWIIVTVSSFLVFVVTIFHLPRLRLRRNKDLARSMSVALTNRAPFLAGVTDSVKDLAVKIGRESGMGVIQLSDLENAALMCDIGLTNTPSSILLKSTEWSAEEQSVYDRHPELSASIIRQISVLRPHAEVVARHHERYENSETIPLASRILCLASDFVRYEQSLGPDRAMLAIEKQSGLHYDPVLVGILRDLE
jgi:HD-GYP domain-containing protein (c-di-GMP phosphodiesterase class II)